MAENLESTLWGIHAGSAGDADSLFLKANVIALGWSQMGDLARLEPDREAFKARVAQVFPDHKPGAIPVHASELYRFVHEMAPGDLIAYSSKLDRKVHLGRVEGAYRYDPKPNPAYPHHRAIKWVRAVPRTHFSQAALYELGSALSLFQIKNYADEFRAALDAKTLPRPDDDADTVARIAADIEANTRDFVLKRLARTLKGHPLAEFVAHLLQMMDYRTRLSPEGPDGGVDILAHRDELGLEPPIIKVQVKSSEGTIGDPQVTALYGKVATGEYGLFVTLGSFSTPAKNFAKGRSNLRLIDGEELVSLVLQHYEQFDAQYKGLIPLRKVYVPEALEAEE